MKKGIWLSLGALLLVGVIVFAIWYINEEGKMHAGSKDSFIPYNSSVVISVNADARLKPEVREAFAGDFERFRKHLLPTITDSLRNQGYVMSHPFVMAARVEGKSDVALLYVMDNKGVLSRGEVVGFLNQAFAAGTEKFRKYDRHKIYSLTQGKETAYFAVCGGIILLSDSDLYIEDGLKQFDLEEVEQGMKPRYQNLNKYFSLGAGINVFLNTAAFTDLLPLYIQVRKIFPHLDVTHFFKWGALDGELNEQGICLNGFLQYGGQKTSYIRTLEKQQPRESAMDAILPSHLTSLGMLNVSNPVTYLSALEAYRYDTGLKDPVFQRKQQYKKMFGKGKEEELKTLLQGEFAVVNLAYNASTRENDGLVIAALKSGSLGKMLLERMLQDYARFDNKMLTDYQRTYSIDREKSFTYYCFPAEDMAATYWGYLFEGIKNRYVLVEDNYWIFASSENAVKTFIKDYVHGNFIRDAEWYQHLKTKLAGKYNMAYFARTAGVLPEWTDWATGSLKKILSDSGDKFSAFPSLAMQWSNEGDMLYNTLYLSSAGIQEDDRPHVLWQTKLEAKVTMKPVPVTNHVTGEKELFVQDVQNNVYLLNDAGRILWKVPLPEKINSEIYQVDLFKNGKLQYLFSTPSKMYLIDRNGNDAGRFPLAFKAKCEQGITLFDYDNDKNYRIFAPCADREVYLYGLDGNLVRGWAPRKADKPIVTDVQHFRVGGKDYIVFADRYRLYILDRKGNERVRISSVFDLTPQTQIYMFNKGGQQRLAFAGRGGVVNLVDFAGKTESLQVEGLSDDFSMNVADVTCNGIDDFVFSDGNSLIVAQANSKVLFRKELEVKNLDYPYVYRFSGADIRIGLMDRNENQMLLLKADGTLSKGFPISGDSPFSIIFSGNDGFFLFAGADNGSVIKYKVQR